MGLYKSMRAGRILSIDPASHSCAFCILEQDKLIAYGKISFKKNMDFSEKCQLLNSALPKIIEKHEPTHIVIEKTIFISNPNTTVVLAYMVGALWSIALSSGDVKVSDVPPMRWKPGIGYKNVRKVEINEWAKEIGEKEAKKKAAFERKERTKRIIDKAFPDHGCEDNDINDAIGIGLWAVKNVL